MTTLDDMVDEVLSNLEGFSQASGASTHLTAGISPTDLILSVNNASTLSTGLVEVDCELMWCVSSDASASNALLAPYGRGYKGTTAVAHALNAQVRMAPNWPKSAIVREINNAIAGVYPMLYGVEAASTFNLSGFTYQFNMPASAQRVVDVRFRFSTLTGWERCREWELEHSAPSTDFTDGVMLSLYGGVPQGATVQVLYAKRPSPLSAGSDDFGNVTGLDDGAKDLIVLAAMARMVRFVDLGRLPNRDAVGDQRQLGSATSLANDLFQQYQVRLSEEQTALSVRYPPRYHKVR